MFHPTFVDKIKAGFDPEVNEMDRRILYEVTGIKFDPYHQEKERTSSDSSEASESQDSAGDSDDDTFFDGF